LVAFGGLVTPQFLQTVLLIKCLRASSSLKGSLSDMFYPTDQPTSDLALQLKDSPLTPSVNVSVISQ